MSEADTKDEDRNGVEMEQEQECLRPRFLRVGQRLFVGTHGGPLPRGQAVQVMMIAGVGARGERRCLVVPIREGGPRRSDWVAEDDLCQNSPED